MIDQLLQEFLDLPDEVIRWYEKAALQACYELGEPYDFLTYWDSLGVVEQRKTIAMLLKEAFPDTPCPRVTLSKRAAPLKTPSLPSANCVPVPPLKTPSLPSANCVPVPNRFDDDSTEKVKKILLTWSKVRFIGNEGSGKTSKALWLCRERMALGHQIYWINPHLKADDKQKLTAANVTIIGGGRDYDAIARFCHQMVLADNSLLNQEYARFRDEVGAKFSPVTFVFDELTNYKDQEVLKDPIQPVMKSSMQEFSKINWNTIYITHNDTLSCMAMPDGTRNLVDSSVFDLKMEADINLGNRIPKSIAKYRMPNTNDWHNVKIPIEWQ